MINVNINMMGVFQEYFSKSLVVEVVEGATILELRKILVIKFADKSFSSFSYLIKNSVFSSKLNVLSDDYVLLENDNIYLLPPFSGG